VANDAGPSAKAPLKAFGAAASKARARSALSRRGPASTEMIWVAMSGVVLLTLGLVDLSLPIRQNISGALVVGPFLASGGSRPRAVVLTGAGAVVIAVGLALADGSGLRASAARITIIVLGTIVAARASSVRLRRESSLVELATVAEVAQGTIIRPPAPRVGHVGVVTSYQSATGTAAIGGDCYEILDTPFGVRAFLGDVRGHGLPAVRLAALVLGGFRALSFLEPDLATVGRELDLFTTRYAGEPSGPGTEGEEFVTGVLVEIRGRSVTVANCGHLPPLLIGATGEVRSLDPSVRTFPLGFGAEPNLDHFEMPAGSRLLLYTDGSVEARDASGRFFDLTRAAGTMGEGSLPEVLAGLVMDLDRHARGRVDDDVAFMIIEA